MLLTLYPVTPDVRNTGASGKSPEPPLLQRPPRIFRDGQKDESWASAFKFRGLVRNAIAALPLPTGNIVAIGATGTVAFVADLNPSVHTLRCNIGGCYR